MHTHRQARGTLAVVASAFLLVLAILANSPVASRADELSSATLNVALVPEHLGQGTTIEFDVSLAGPHGTLPLPVTNLALLYPQNFGIFTSGLGLASCDTAALEAFGPAGCPSRSLMGYGTATGAIQIENQVIDEKATTAVFMAPFQNGEITLLFYLDAFTPLQAERIFQGTLQPALPPYSGALAIAIPSIEGLLEGPDVALVKLSSTIGPLGITYYERIHAKFVPYQPGGILLPRHCPQRGFPFAARFTFANGRQMTTTTRVRCPPNGARSRPRR